MILADAALFGQVLVLGFGAGVMAGLVTDTLALLWHALTKPAPRRAPCPICARLRTLPERRRP